MRLVNDFGCSTSMSLRGSQLYSMDSFLMGVADVKSMGTLQMKLYLSQELIADGEQCPLFSWAQEPHGHGGTVWLLSNRTLAIGAAGSSTPILPPHSKVLPEGVISVALTWQEDLVTIYTDGKLYGLKVERTPL